MATRTNSAIWLEKQKRWQIKVQADGERRTFSCSTPGRAGKSECHRKADEWLEQRTVNTNTKVRVLLPLWIDTLKETTSPDHWRQYDGYVRNWIDPVIGNIKICDVTEQKLQSVINNAYKEGRLAFKTLSNIRSALFSFIKYCRRSGYTKLKPDDLEIPQGAVKGTRVILQPNDIKLLFSRDTELYKRQEIKAWFIHAFRFAVVTGLRPGEIIAAKKTCCTKDGRFVIRESLNDSQEFTHGKNDNARRTFMLSKRAQKILSDQEELLKQEGVISPFLFPEQNGQHTNQQNLRRAWSRFKKHNGIVAATPYEMRHTFVSVNKDMPEGLKKMVIGHSKDMDTEGTYGHEMQGDMERAAEYIDAAFDRLLK